MTEFPVMNVISRTWMARVFRSWPPTDEYSQLRIPKNSAPPNRWARASSRFSLAWRRQNLNTIGGKAFWCFVGGSLRL